MNDNNNIYIIKELTQHATLKGTILLGGQETRKARKSQKSRSEEKLEGFSSAFLFPARIREAVTRVETTGIDHPTWRITRGTGIVKG